MAEDGHCKWKLSKFRNAGVDVLIGLIVIVGIIVIVSLITNVHVVSDIILKIVFLNKGGGDKISKYLKVLIFYFIFQQANILINLRKHEST